MIDWVVGEAGGLHSREGVDSCEDGGDRRGRAAEIRRKRRQVVDICRGLDVSFERRIKRDFSG